MSNHILYNGSGRSISEDTISYDNETCRYCNDNRRSVTHYNNNPLNPICQECKDEKTEEQIFNEQQL